MMRGVAPLLEHFGPLFFDNMLKGVPPSRREELAEPLKAFLDGVIVQVAENERENARVANAHFIANVAADLLAKSDGPRDDAAVRECVRLAALVIAEADKAAKP